MNRRLPIRKRIYSANFATLDTPPPLPEYVEQKYRVCLFGVDDPKSSIISARIEDDSVRPTRTATLFYTRKDYFTKGFGNVYVELEKELYTLAPVNLK